MHNTTRTVYVSVVLFSTPRSNLKLTTSSSRSQTYSSTWKSIIHRWRSYKFSNTHSHRCSKNKDTHFCKDTEPERSHIRNPVRSLRSRRCFSCKIFRVSWDALCLFFFCLFSGFVVHVNVCMRGGRGTGGFVIINSILSPHTWYICPEGTFEINLTSQQKKKSTFRGQIKNSVDISPSVMNTSKSQNFLYFRLKASWEVVNTSARTTHTHTRPHPHPRPHTYTHTRTPNILFLARDARL